MNVLLQSLPYLAKGALETLWMSVVAVGGGTLLGLVLGIAAMSRLSFLRSLIDAYVFAVRGIPILVLMFVTYYFFPAVGYRISNSAAVTLALVLYAGAFYTDIVRGALSAVPRGQTEAAKSLGIRRLSVILNIVFPQAIAPSVPPWLNTSIVIIKSTSYASIVGAWELTYASREIVERTLDTFWIFGGAMIFYFVICYPISFAASRLGRRTVVHH
jgi:His/Glu/Gln/Arg/opine family amino acid ABC transporter permease subunit